MKSAHFTPVERLNVEAVIKQYNYVITHDCWLTANSLLTGHTISKKSMANWRTEMLSPKRTKKAKVSEVNELSLGLPLSETGVESRAAAAPQIDLSGKSRLEILDLAIDARLSLLATQVTQIADSSLAKIVADLIESRRRELGIPQPVMDALSALGRLHGIIQLGIANGTAEAETTLRTMIEMLSDVLEKPADALEIGDGGGGSHTARNPEFSSLTVAELVEELLATPILHNEWMEIQRYMWDRLREKKQEKGLSGYAEIPRNVREAAPEIIELTKLFVPQYRNYLDIDFRPAFRALIDRIAAAQWTFTPAEAAKPAPVDKEVLSDRASDELEDLPESSAVVQAEKYLKRTKGEPFAGIYGDPFDILDGK